MEGQAKLLFQTLQELGWVELLDLRLTTFAEVGLVASNTDRIVWRRAQELGMLLLTDNRNKSGSSSLEQTLLNEATDKALPTLTISRVQRLMTDPAYREACAERVAEIVIDLETYRGVPRLYIP